jgi:hypothetical protein
VLVNSCSPVEERRVAILRPRLRLRAEGGGVPPIRAAQGCARMRHKKGVAVGIASGNAGFARLVDAVVTAAGRPRRRVLSVLLAMATAAWTESSQAAERSAVLDQLQVLRFAPTPLTRGAFGDLDLVCARRTESARATADGCSAGGSDSGCCSRVLEEGSAFYPADAAPNGSNANNTNKENADGSLYRNRRAQRKLHVCGLGIERQALAGNTRRDPELPEPIVGSAPWLAMGLARRSAMRPHRQNSSQVARFPTAFQSQRNRLRQRP